MSFLQIGIAFSLVFAGVVLIGASLRRGLSRCDDDPRQALRGYEEAAQQPQRLQRVDGYNATVILLRASTDVRDGDWIKGAPTHVLADLLTALASRGYYLGVEEDRNV